MMLIFLLLVLIGLPLMLMNKTFAQLALVSTYAGLAHLLLLAGVMGVIWFSVRYEAISRVWRRRTR